MERTQLNFLLIGKTGHGKSETGNTILNRKEFETSSSGTSKTKEVKNSSAEFGDYTLLVVDGPGLQDTNLSKVEDKEAAVKNMDIALAKCYSGVDAFLLVIKYETRFTQEEKDTLDALKKILGDRFMEHVIVVVTYGDNFRSSMRREGTPEKTIHDWCREQKDALRQLYDDCKGRVVLFNNDEQDEGKKRAPVQEVVELTKELRSQSGRYTSQCFETAKVERDKLILDLKAPQLKENFQIKISLLVAAIEDLAARPSEVVKVKVEKRVNDLREEINQEDQGYPVVKEMQETLYKVEENLGDKKKLITYGKELETIRQAKSIWGVIGAICTVVGGCISIVAPALGALVAAGGAAFSAVAKSLTSEEKEIKQ